MNKSFFTRAMDWVMHAAWAWILLIVMFLFAGITSHDPWKQDETYSFGIIYHFLTTHSWLVPTNAGEPFMEKPPLYYWTAVMLCKLLGGVMQLHNAARTASFLYMLVATYFIWKSSQTLWRDAVEKHNLSWRSVLLFLGTLGIAGHSHDMFTDIALLAGASIALYGLALWVMRENYIRSGFWFGLGFGIAFLSKGLFTPIVFGIATIMLFITMPALRTRKTVYAAAIAFITAVPFLFLWPISLYRAHPDLFYLWFWTNNVGRFLGFSVPQLGAGNESFYFVKALLWFAFPVFPLACMIVWKNRRNWQQPQLLVPLSVLLPGLFFLMVSATGRALYLLPLMPAFAALATQGIALVSPRALRIWNNTTRIIFTLGSALILFTWWSLIHPIYANALQAFYHAVGKFLPLDYPTPPSQWPVIIMVLAIIAFWLASLRLDPRTPLNAARIWLAGIALIWCSHILLMPWIDETRSYRPEIESLNQFLRTSPHRGDCIGGFFLGESIAPMLEYFGDRHEVAPYQTFDGTQCPLILVDVSKNEPDAKDPRSHIIWRMARPLDTKNMEMRLYERKR